jgi:aromatic-L-amino-acid decarboxylase
VRVGTRPRRRHLAGIGRADSVTLDPHKTLFLPFGTGALVVRDPARLRAVHESTAAYLPEDGPPASLPDYANAGGRGVARPARCRAERAIAFFVDGLST